MNYITELLTIETLIGSKLSDASLIEPTDLRSVIGSLVYFLRKISPLASGVFEIGDTGLDELRTVNLPYNVGTSDYRVVGSLVSKGADFNKDNDVIEMVREKTPQYFKLCLRELSGNVQNLEFEWAIYPKN